MSLSSGHKAKESGVARLNLALQGGGAHGAFTWGVLDRLLDEEDIEIAGITGTSAGAMNAAVMVSGYAMGGRAMAKANLHEFWYQVSVAAGGNLTAYHRNPLEMAAKWPGLEWLGALKPMDTLTRTFSPYELNPFNINPLREVLEKTVQFEMLNDTSMHLFVTATNVETGQPRIFTTNEITIDVLLASACLPFVYQAVEIDGVPYWDGGYVGNPSIWPLIYKTSVADVLLVQINPLNRPGTPKNATDIIDRLNEISFNSSLVAEMRAINFVKRLIHDGHLSGKNYTDVHMHMVKPDHEMECMTASSKMDANWNFFQYLHDAGRSQMTAWLRQHKKALGKHSTVNIEQTFLTKPKPIKSPHPKKAN
jgi:NTE family protein